MIILVDQDSVMADFDGGIDRHLKRMFPDIKLIAPEDRTSFYIDNDYDPEYRQAIIDIMRQKGFFRELDPIPGAIDGINELLDAGHHVMICTSPLSREIHTEDERFSARCAREKYEWIDAHLGAHMVDRAILTRDKTLVIGDVLIDDKPDIRGVAVPTWQHLVFGHAYNKGLPNRAEDWKQAVEIIHHMTPQLQLATPALATAPAYQFRPGAHRQRKMA